MPFRSAFDAGMKTPVTSFTSDFCAQLLLPAVRPDRVLCPEDKVDISASFRLIKLSIQARSEASCATSLPPFVHFPTFEANISELWEKRGQVNTCRRCLPLDVWRKRGGSCAAPAEEDRPRHEQMH